MHVASLHSPNFSELAQEIHVLEPAMLPQNATRRVKFPAPSQCLVLKGGSNNRANIRFWQTEAYL